MNSVFIVAHFVDLRDYSLVPAVLRIRDELPGSYFLELRNHFFGLKYLKSLMRIQDPGWEKFGSWIRVGKKSDPGSGINIPDPQHYVPGVFFWLILWGLYSPGRISFAIWIL